MGKNRSAPNPSSEPTIVAPAVNTSTLKRGAFLEIYEVLAQIHICFDNQLHRYCAVSMRHQMKAKADAIFEMRQAPQKILPVKYNEAREAILVELSTKDTQGRPIIVGNQYAVTVEARRELERRTIELRKDPKYKTSVEVFEACVAETDELLNGTEEFVLPSERLKLSWFNKSVGQLQIEILFPLIAFDDAAKKSLAST
jgi:hypothetical protein